MARIFSFFLIILVMNNQVMSQNIFGIDFGTIKQAYNYINLVYTKGYEYANRDVIKRNSPAQQLKNIMTEIKTISKQLDNFENHIDESLNDLRNFSLNNIGNMIDFYDARSELLKHIESVNLLFKRGMALEENGNYNNNILRTFLYQVLYDRYNLEYSLFEIYKLILPGTNTIIRKGFITLANDYATKNYERLCNKGSSSQQHMFYVFELLIRTHLRGFTTLTQAHSMRTIFDNSNYIQEYENIKKRSHEQLTNYTKVFMHELNNLRADIRSCDVKNPIIGKNVYEMEGLFRVIVNTEEKIKAAVYDQMTPVCGNCEEIRNSYEKYRFHNCKSYVSVKGCPESEMNLNGKSVRYKWFTADSKTFGHRGKCDYALYDLNDHYGAYWCKNDICACSMSITRSDYIPSESRSFYFYPNFAPYIVDTDLHIDAPKIMSISVEPQYSDIANNMVVMGVRFMLHDNAIHLQIQQRKISESSAVIKEAVWKRVDVDSENKPINISHDNVYYDRSSIYLDDVMVHPDFLVTGVKLHPTKNDDGFELHVHATQFNAKTGLLRGSQRWFKPGEYTPNQQDYERNRTKITINDPDNPILRNDYYPDPETNKFIQFQHTSVVKDAGYHTVPFFDGQSVQSPLFPLGGVGLFYRHQNGFGGYIAPRLLTYNITWNIESSFNAWRNIEKAYEKCGLKVPPNPIEVDENTTCKTLSQMVTNPIQDQNVDDKKYTTSSIRGQSPFNNNSPTLNTRYDSTGNDYTRNTISKDYY